MKKSKGFVLIEVVCYIGLILIFATAFLNAISFSVGKSQIYTDQALLAHKKQNLETFIKRQLAGGSRIVSLQDGDVLVNYIIFSKDDYSFDKYEAVNKKIRLTSTGKLILETNNQLYTLVNGNFVKISEASFSENVVQENVTFASSKAEDGRANFTIKIEEKGKEETLEFSLPYEKSDFDFLF